METRTLGRSKIEVSPLGFGCWAVGGPFLLDGLPDGWGDVDDDESVRAIRTALDQGINFFDTSDAYGTGHSEHVIGRALKGRRDQAVVATKFGFTYNAGKRELYTVYDVSPQYIRQACEASLRRLDTDYIDLYQIHVGHITMTELDDVIPTLEALKQEGKIRAYGWSTWDKKRAEEFARKTSEAGTAIQHPYNVLIGEPAMVDVCEQYDLASINNAPLAMGLLSGKFNADSRLPADDVRGTRHEWVIYFQDGRPKPEYLEALTSIREILRSDGRTLVQGALAWIWGASQSTLPIPGLKTTRQVMEAAEAMRYGPLSPRQMTEIEEVLRNTASTT